MTKNSDALDFLRALESQQQSSKQAENAFAQSWQRLKTLYDDLQKEAGERKVKLNLQETDVDVIYDKLLADFRRSVEHAKKSVKDAQSALEAHETDSGMLGLKRLQPDWWKKRADLVRDLEGKVNTRDLILEGAKDKEWSFKKISEEMARRNTRDNERLLKPIKPLLDRIAGIELAMRAIQAKCDPAHDCLARWDIEALVKIAKTWERLEEYGRVGEAEWDYYARAGRSSPAVMEASRLFDDLTRNGLIIDGEWEPVFEQKAGSNPQGIRFLTSDQQRDKKI